MSVSNLQAFRLIPLDYIAQKIFAEASRLWSSSLFDIPSPVIIPLLGPHILLSSLFSDTTNFFVPGWETSFHTYVNKT